jgi:hypothetical protein
VEARGERAEAQTGISGNSEARGNKISTTCEPFSTVVYRVCSQGITGVALPSNTVLRSLLGDLQRITVYTS